MKKVVAIYHKDCPDGTAAAAVVLKKFPEAHVFPLQHTFTKEETDPIFTLIDNETDVYTVDCVIGVKEILAMGYKVTSLDHHISTKEESEKLAKENPDFKYIFDINKSGASIAWSYFFPNTETPDLIKYIEDFDIWRNALGENTKFVGHVAVTLRDNPEKMLDLLNTDINVVLNNGKIVSDYADYTVQDEFKQEPIKLKIGNNIINAYNVSSINSTIIAAMHYAEIHQAVVCYRIDGQYVKYSFRSNDQYNPSALDFASKIGGGGHRNSSGAKTSLKVFLDMIVRE